MLPPSAWDIAIRSAQSADIGRVDVVAAIDLHNGRAVANPWKPTAEAVGLLQLRREPLRGEMQARRSRRRHPLTAIAGLLR